MKRLLFGFFLMVVCLPVFASGDLIPLNPAVKTGTLSNGLRYFILENSKPAQRAELRLIVNAGSLLEQEEQQGLAHFLEHMAFNGTAHFPKNALIDYLEHLGTRFGPHWNAVTGFTETQFMMQVPTIYPGTLDTALLVLSDWATGISFDSLEIEKERGVVIEEWRLGQGAEERMRKMYWSDVFSGSRYTSRLPIGKPDVINSFRHARLKDFYTTWYRPDCMAIVAVGDFNASEVERKILDRFGAIEKKTNTVPLPEFIVPDHKGVRVSLAKDPENEYSTVTLLYKLKEQPLHTEGDFREQLIYTLFIDCLNARLQELNEKPDPPFLFASVNRESLVRGKDSYTAVAFVKEGEWNRGLQSITEENLRVLQHGFTLRELERQKRALQRNAEKTYTERAFIESKQHAADLCAFFISGNAAPGVEAEYALYSSLMPGITLEEVNARIQHLFFRDENLNIIIQSPEKDGLTYPDPKAIEASFREYLSIKTSPYQDKLLTKPLLNGTPPPGKVVGKKRILDHGFCEWQLSNGCRVWFKKTDFRNDEILMMAHATGGTSLSSDNDLLSAAYSTQVVQQSGIGNYAATELAQFLEDKDCYVIPSIGETSQSLSGRTSGRDLDTFFSLVYAHFKQIRQDRNAFTNLLEEQKALYENNALSPESVFRDSVAWCMSGYNPRNKPITAARVAALDEKKALSFYSQRFRSAGDWTFVFVGSIQEDTLRRYCEKYLAGMDHSMPGDAYRSLTKNNPHGAFRKTIRKGREEKAVVTIKWNHGSFRYTWQERNEVVALVKALSTRLREVLREDKGGVYGVSVFPTMRHYPYPYLEITLSFGCDPARVDELIRTTQAELDLIRSRGIQPELWRKIAESMKRERETDLKENSFWMDVAMNAVVHRERMETADAQLIWINGVNEKLFATWAERYMPINECKQFILLPESP